MTEKPRRWAAFLTGQADEPVPTPEGTSETPPRATDVPLIPSDAPRRPATRVARPAAQAPIAPPPMTLGPDGEPVPIVAIPDYAAPPGAVVSAGFDENGVEYVFEDDPGADPLVDPRYDADDRNWVRYRTSWGGFLRVIGLVVLLLIVVTTVRGRIYGWIDDQIEAGGEHGDEVPFKIEEGAAVNDIATKLADAGIINNATVFRYWLRCDVPNGGDITIFGFLGCDTEVQFQAGDYDLFENMTYDEVVAAFALGPKEEVTYEVRIPEGLRVSQFVERLLEENDLYDRENLTTALGDPSCFSEFLRDEASVFWPHEGLLFPAVYDIPEQSLADELQMICRMSDEFDRRMETLLTEAGGLPEYAEAQGFDAYDIVIVASLIEEEAFLDEDRAKISRVIWNRLEQGWKLGIDATACYFPDISCADLLQSNLDDPNLWNTRAIEGLPFTPISAPGEASLRAALMPEDGPWMYYVLTPDGEEGQHVFVETDEEFQAAKAACEAADLGCG